MQILKFSAQPGDCCNALRAALHWQPDTAADCLKLCYFVRSWVVGIASVYLQELLCSSQRSHAAQRLRSSTYGDLSVPRVATDWYGWRAILLCLAHSFGTALVNQLTICEMNIEHPGCITVSLWNRHTRQIMVYNFLRWGLPLFWCKTVPDGEIIPLRHRISNTQCKTFCRHQTDSRNFTVAFGYRHLARLVRVFYHRVPDSKSFQLCRARDI